MSHSTASVSAATLPARRASINCASTIGAMALLDTLTPEVKARIDAATASLTG